MGTASLVLMPHVLFIILGNCCLNRRKERIKGILKSVSKPTYGYLGYLLISINMIFFSIFLLLDIEIESRYEIKAFLAFIVLGSIFVNWSRQRRIY